MTSSAGFLNSGCSSMGIPRPLSEIMSKNNDYDADDIQVLVGLEGVN